MENLGERNGLIDVIVTYIAPGTFQVIRTLQNN